MTVSPGVVVGSIATGHRRQQRPDTVALPDSVPPPLAIVTMGPAGHEVTLALGGA